MNTNEPQVNQPSKSQPRTSQPRTGSIVWGTLVLVFCAFVTSHEMGNVIDPTTWIIGSILGIGALLLIVGLTIVLRGPKDRE